MPLNLRKIISAGTLGLVPAQIAAATSSNDASTQTTSQKSPQQLQAEARLSVQRDLAEGSEFAKGIIGGGLERLSSNQDITDIRSQLRQQALEGGDSQTNLRRSIAVKQLQGQADTAGRQLSGQLGRTGVRGGAAAAAELELQARALNARGDLEANLALQQAGQQRQALTDLANFTFKTQQFDISQGEKERALELQSQLGFANLVSNERSAIRQQEIAQLVAEAERSKSSGGKK